MTQHEAFEFQPILTGRTITLRPLRDSDLESLYAAASDPLIWELHPDPERYQREAFESRYFSGALDSGSALVAIDNANGDIVGCSRYYEWDPVAEEVAIGFTFLARSRWGGATNREMKTLMLDHAFKWARRVWFHIGSDNRRSRRGTEKVGARFSHETQKEINGQVQDYAYYFIDRPPVAPSEVLAFSEKIAREAGALMLAELRRGDGPAEHFKHAGQELVTEADIKADNLICDAIRARFPGHQILAEESAPDLSQLSQSTGPLWVIDPIDGTVNYAHGHQHSAVSIAWLVDGVLQTGVVYNPYNDEMFSAAKGQGANLNGRPIHVAQKTDLRRALFATGFPYIKSDMARLVRRLDVMLTHCADLRRMGSAALDICWVAAGRLDVYYENLSVWDFAAAQLIAIEAGARYGHFLPVPEGVSPVFHNKNILVSNDTLYTKVKDVLLQAEE
ncbi:inositol monophosphatase family protein [Pseudohongiella sp.]|uniref:inositol-phosphate phosphatase n=1 Tax=marine sediment metagenome TaxID=412755 RepID=A0A0F9VS95_9ZZZZ|nr:inositol monophosphatase family protein [Pseudohongiella sp.]